VLDVFVTEIRLEASSIVASVGQGVAAAMPEHVLMYREDAEKIPAGPVVVQQLARWLRSLINAHDRTAFRSQPLRTMAMLAMSTNDQCA
jgi:hypothetical protein